MITVFEVGGTATLFDVDGVGKPSIADLQQMIGIAQAAIDGIISPVAAAAATPATYSQAMLHPSLVDHRIVLYPAAAWPMDLSIAQGDTALDAAINAVEGAFGILAFSQGAWVASNCYDRIRGGSLAARDSDFLGGVVCGNPRREETRTFPGCPDVGGQGAVFHNLLSGTETRWFEMANPGDLVCTNDHTTVAGIGVVIATQIFTGGWDGTQAALTELLTSNAIWNLADAFAGVKALLLDLVAGPHQQYGTSTPLAPADMRTSAQISYDYFHAMALGWDGCTAPPVATSIGGNQATVVVNTPAQAGTYDYAVNQFDITASTLSVAVLSGAPVVGVGQATMTVDELIDGHLYTFAVVLITTYTDPTVTPVSTMSNQVIASGVPTYGFAPASAVGEAQPGTPVFAVVAYHENTFPWTFPVTFET